MQPAPLPEPLIVRADLADFFREEVLAACVQVGVRMDAATEWYVVQLLCEMSHQKAAPEPAQEQPLALVYGQAQQAAAPERTKLLKGLGDRALLVAGYFAESVEKSLVDLSYYVTMGRTAYLDLSGLYHHGHRHEALEALFSQLGRGFSAYVDVLNQVASRAQRQSGNDADLLRLYERYMKTGNQRVKKMLEGRGLHLGTDAESGSSRPGSMQ